VSPSSTAMSSAGMPSSSARICAYVVSCPWPCDFVPNRAIAFPVGWIRTSHESNIFSPRMSNVWDGPAPTISVKLEIPIPISSPRARFSACSFRRAS